MTAHVAFHSVSLAARAQGGSDHGLLPLGDKYITRSFTPITPVSRVLPARVAHGNKMPVALPERHPRKLVAVILRNTSEKRYTRRRLRSALGQIGHSVRVAHRTHAT